MNYKFGDLYQVIKDITLEYDPITNDCKNIIFAGSPLNSNSIYYNLYIGQLMEIVAFNYQTNFIRIYFKNQITLNISEFLLDQIVNKSYAILISASTSTTSVSPSTLNVPPPQYMQFLKIGDKIRFINSYDYNKLHAQGISNITGPQDISSMVVDDILTNSTYYIIRLRLYPRKNRIIQYYVFEEDIQYIEPDNNITLTSEAKITPVIKSNCTHPRKYKNIISPTMSFFVCPDCKADLGNSD